MNKFLYAVALLLGAGAVCWVGAGYAGTNPLALTMTALIGAFFAMGALELRRFQQATDTLAKALQAVPAGLTELRAWLGPVHASLQNPVRLRIEGERVGLPGPALTPYLVGLLVLLGMLGTFLGMVVTLKGTVSALDATADLHALRASLSAPMQGLGLAFGTSIAGVSTSAMLGLMSALCRRDRLHVAQRLDTCIATELRAFSLAHRRDETFRALQASAGLMPVLLDRMEGMMAQLERQGQASAAQLHASQDRFHRQAEAAYAGLASDVGKSLQASLAESARVAGATIQPAVEATMDRIARETAALHERVADTVTRQLDGLATRLDTAVTGVTEGWSVALGRHERTSVTLTEGLQAALDHFGATFEQRSAALLTTVEGAHHASQERLAATLQETTSAAGSLHAKLADTVALQLGTVSERFGAALGGVSQTWRDALAEHRDTSAHLADQTRQSRADFLASFEQRATSLLATVDRAHGSLQTELAARDQQRLTAFSQAIERMADSLSREWQQAGAHHLRLQEALCETLEATARDIGSQAQTQASATLTEVSRLLQAASQAPHAAAEVIDQWRQKLADSGARDDALLEERTRLMATLGELLDTVHRGATEQRGSIDALVESSAALLARIGERFTEQVDAQSGQLTEAAAQVAGSAVEVSSLGEAFGFGVQLFGASNEKLMARLQSLEASLGKSVARSDEQLAYFVAQAREIIDLSIGSQKQIVEDLQQLAIRQTPVASETF